MNPPPLIPQATMLLMRPSQPFRYIRTSQVSQSPPMSILVTFPRISCSCSRPLLYLRTMRIVREQVTRWENSLEAPNARTARTIAYVVILAMKALAQGLLIPATPARVSISQKGIRTRRTINLGNPRATRARNPKLLILARLVIRTGAIRQMVAIFLRLPINLRESRLARLNPVQWLSSEGVRKSRGVEVMMKMRIVYLLYLRSPTFKDPRARSHLNAVPHHHHPLGLVFLLCR